MRTHLNYSLPHSIKSNIKNIVFNGGGILGAAFPGGIEVLEKQNIMQNINNFAGSSAGAIMALICTLGYTSDEMKDILHETDFSSFMEAGILDVEGLINGDISSLTSLIGIPKALEDLYFNLGVCDGQTVRTWFENVIMNKGLNPNITFNEFYKITNKGLIVNSLNTSRIITKIHSYLHTPNERIVDGCLSSMSIPFLYKPVVLDNDYNNDGGTNRCYILDIFDELCDTFPNENFEGETLGFYLSSKEKILNPERVDISNIIALFANVVQAWKMTSIRDVLRRQSNIDRTIFIDTGDISFLNFSLTDEQTKLLLDNCKKSTEDYFNLNI